MSSFIILQGWHQRQPAGCSSLRTLMFPDNSLTASGEQWLFADWHLWPSRMQSFCASALHSVVLPAD